MIFRALKRKTGRSQVYIRIARQFMIASVQNRTRFTKETIINITLKIRKMEHIKTQERKKRFKTHN